jgi:hypothetical protein
LGRWVWRADNKSGRLTAPPLTAVSKKQARTENPRRDLKPKDRRLISAHRQREFACSNRARFGAGTRFART